MSRRLGSLDFRANHVAAGDVDFLPPDHGNDIAFANQHLWRSLQNSVTAANAQDEDAGLFGEPLQFGDRLVDEIGIGDPIGANIERACGGRDTFGGVTSGPDLRAHSRRLLPEVGAHELGSDRREEPDQSGRADQVGHGIGNGDIVDERRPFRFR